jgi:Protein of unknown function (DUF1488)
MKNIECTFLFELGEARPQIDSVGRTERMPLRRAIERYMLREDGIYFLMQDGPEEVVCRITLEALSKLDKTTGIIGPTEIFESGRHTIERAAGNKYDRTSRHAYEVVTITTDDLGLEEA